MALAQIVSPSQAICLAEQNATGASNNDLEMVIGTSPTYITNSRFQSHTGYANFLFADGHVKAMRPTATATSAPVLNMWTIDPFMAPSANLLGWLAEEQNAMQ